MGSGTIDIYTFLHFLSGIMATYVLYPNDIYISFILSNIGHFIMEVYEQNIHPDTGVRLETDTNHVTDIIAFFFGSIIAIVLYQVLTEKYLCKTNVLLRIILLFIVGLIVLFEISREIFPRYYLTEYLKGAYI